MSEITNYINNDFKAIDSEDRIESVKDFFYELTFSHFPVVEHEIYIGCITADDMETFENDKKIIDYSFSFERFFARTNMIWLDILEIFAKNNTNLVPILDENNKYVGYYEIEDVVRFFNETPFIKEPGRIIIVKKGIQEYSVSQIAQIVENNDGKILGLFVSETETDRIQVTIKINIGAMNEIIQSFRRYDYEIISEHPEDNYINTLKERSKYLDKYLNI